MKDAQVPDGAAIQEKRQRLGRTRKELADSIGLSLGGERLIRDWELGLSLPPKTVIRDILDLPEEPKFLDPVDAKFRLIDLFAGIGGIRLGFHRTGRTRVVFSSEINKFSVKTYRANFGDEPAGDITKIAAIEIPDHDILAGGFPCQAFSLAGKKLGFEDTRGTLFFDIARILSEKRPKAFLLENVKNLQSHDGGKTFQVIEKTLSDLGYSVTTKVLKARDFGVPQNRERIYIVGFDRDQVNGYDKFRMPIPPQYPTRVGDILENGVDEKYTISDRLWHGHQRRRASHAIKGNGFGYNLVDAESSYTSTISARYYKDGSEILVDQPGRNPRKLTPREAGRLQGFPDEFVIPVSDTQAYQQFGNSVAVPVIYAIADNMIRVLEGQPIDRQLPPVDDSLF